MQMQIKTLIIWPKSESFSPRLVEFELGKVNVITGASRTGKSAIIPIIDYCLASTDCSIPIDTIRDNASWYGIIVQTENEQLLICRKVPEGNKVSNDFFLMRAKELSAPPKIDEPNEKSEGIKAILNSITGVPYFALGSDENVPYQARLSFRDLMAFVFQSQDIVANQNILFYKTHAHEHRERLRNWFPYILGAENLQVLAARQKANELEKRIAQLRREFDKASAVSASWMANMRGHLTVAKHYGLLKELPTPDSTPEELLVYARQIVEEIPENSQTTLSDIEITNTQVQELEKEEQFLSREIGITRKRLNDLNQLQVGLVDYGDSIRKRTNRLGISTWLKALPSNDIECPVCGSHDHPNSIKEINKIVHAFEKYEGEAKSVAEIPTSFSREEEHLKSNLTAMLEKKEANQKQLAIVLNKDRQANEEFQLRKNMYLFLGQLKSSLETFERLTDSGEFQIEIDSLSKEYEELRKVSDLKAVLRKTEIATSRISTKMLTHLATLDVEDKYRLEAPKFDVRNLNISVRSNDGHWHFLSQVGSASNWVSFHIALMCALQEYFAENQKTCVPTFVIFDQPSQVYFPKVSRKTSEPLDNVNYLDEDVEAVRSIFTTLANSIKSNNGLWQAIILDHANESIYKDIDGVYEVEEWRDGKKLIPDFWIKPI